MIKAERAQEIIETLFTFENVGDAMIAVRRDLSSQNAQERLIMELVNHAVHMVGDDSSETFAIITEAAKVRVQQFVEGATNLSKGCGRRM